MEQNIFHNTSMLPPPPTDFKQIPILRSAIDAYKLWHGFLNAMPRMTKYTLGARIDGLFGSLIENLSATGFAKKENKMTHLDFASVNLDLIKLFLRVAWEIKALDHKKYAAISVPINDIGRMLGGWRKHLIT